MMEYHELANGSSFIIGGHMNMFGHEVPAVNRPLSP